MGWKSIEMQVALPRTQDAGKLQEQIEKQHQHFQESFTANQLKQEELKRKQVNEFERIKLLNNNKQRDIDQVLQNEVKKKKSQLEKEFGHPYLGKKIDFNG